MIAHSRIETQSSIAMLLLVVTGLSIASFSVDASVGKFRFVTGEVVVVGIDGRTRRAARGSEVDAREVVRTGARAIAQLKMIDDATRYLYAPIAKCESTIIGLGEMLDRIAVYCRSFAVRSERSRASLVNAIGGVIKSKHRPFRSVSEVPMRSLVTMRSMA